MTHTVFVVDYREIWPRLFAEEAARLRSAVGAAFTTIEHVGSTAVPGLAAKPVIDIMPGIVDLAAFDADNTHERLIGMGYIYRDDLEVAMPYRRYFVRIGDNPEHPKGHVSHVHIVEVGSAFWVRHLAFRDYLRAHPTERDAYGAYKQHIAPQYTDTGAYSEAKHEFIQAMQAKALTWYGAG